MNETEIVFKHFFFFLLLLFSLFTWQTGTIEWASCTFSLRFAEWKTENAYQQLAIPLAFSNSKGNKKRKEKKAFVRRKWNTNQMNTDCNGLALGGLGAALTINLSNDKRTISPVTIPNMTKYYHFRADNFSNAPANKSMQMRIKRWPEIGLLMLLLFGVTILQMNMSTDSCFWFQWQTTEQINDDDNGAANRSAWCSLSHCKCSTITPTAHKWSFWEEIKWKMIIIKWQTRNHNAIEWHRTLKKPGFTTQVK